MKKYLHQLSKIKTPYLILGLLTLIFSITISFLLYYQTKPSFSPLPPQNGVFQDPDTIDTTIKSISFNKYQYQNSNQVPQTSFRNDPTDSAAIQFANKYADLSFFTNSTQSFAEANPEVEPTIDGSTITYPAIFPHTDLRYTVEPSRLLEEFIVHDRETALSMTEITQTLDRSNIDSYKEVDGSIELYKDQVLIATVPKPVMYESGDQESRSYDLAYTIKEINNNTLSITKVINETGIAWLSDPDRQYPIVIDLVIDNADTAASWVSSDTTNTVVTQETTIKQEGTGSVKVATTAEVSTTLDLMEYAYDHVAQTPASNNISATGGTITYSGGYTIHTFTSSGTFTVNSGSGNVEYLVVGGGGGGGRHSGAGGGGGGFRTATDYAVTAQGYTVTVGAGGASLYGTYPTQGGGLGLNGANSVFDTITALGGGGGGWASAIGNVGGSGGGSARALGVGAAGTAGQGNAGGTSSISGTPYPAAGGGGAGAIGGSPTTSAGGAGGSGLASSISGSSVTYAGGGGGNVQDTYPSGGGAGGSGGGGAGAGSDSNYGYDGTANTGGGGGGAHYNAPAAGTDTRSSRGGSGIVIVRYPTAGYTTPGYVSNATMASVGGTITYSGGYTIHTFTSSGTFTVNSGSGNVEYLVVGGGGGGGRHSGAGGGGGGFRTATDYAVTAQGYTVTVGAGGASLYGTYPTQGGGLGLNGANSVFDTITALGGGGGGWASAIGNVGGSGGGSARALGVGAAGTAGQGNAGGTSSISGTPYPAAGGGGAGAIGGSPTTSAGGAGGSGLASSISGSSVTYAGGGGGNVQDTYPSGGGAGGSGGGGAGAGSDSNYGYDGTANTGGGGGGAHYNAPAAGTDTRSSRGGSGVVIARYPTTPVLQSYSEASIKTQGSYSLKGVASTNAASKTLTRTISSPLNLAGHDTINFDIRSSRTGSNIKIGIHDTGGTTTEITPNITSANTFQAKSWDISGVSNANKDAIDKIIITIVNASSANTFYIDDMTATGRSLNDTVTLTKSSTDLSGQDNITYWVRSNSTGSFARFEFGESASSEQTDAFTINSANTWEQKTWDITGISAASRNAVTKFAFKLTSDTNGAILYFDDIQTTLNNVAPNTPSLDLPTDTATNQSLLPVLKTTATDDDSDYLRYKIELCEDVGMSVSCQTFDQTSSQTGWSGQNTQTSTAYTSGTQATYTLQTPLAVNDTFYWRSYAIDPAGTNTWSSTQTPYSFTTTTAPTAPTTPYTEGATNPTGVGDLTPEFSAVHNDADGDSASYYQIEVNTASNFAGTSMWDSTKTSMTTTANGVRSPDISYAGTSLALDGSGYYWRIKFWDTLGAEGVVSATQNFGMNVKPTTPSLELPTNTDTNQSLLPVLKTTTTDADSDYLRYKIELCEDVGMSVSCQTFDQTSSQTGWSGQDAQTSTAYVSGTQATYTLQSALAANDTFYWRSYAIDPAGTNTWSSTQTPYSFSTTSAPTAPTTPYTEGTTNPTGVIDLTPEFSAVHNDGDGDSANYYQIIVNTQVGFDGTEMWDSGKTSMTTTANGVRSPDISYAGTSLALDDTTYYWHVKFWNTLGAEGTYSATANFGMNILPNTPSLDLPTDTATNQSVLPILKTTGTDTDSDYLRYKIQICTDLAMTTGCNTYDQTSSQTGWTGQNTQTSTAYTSGAQATYTLQSALNTSSTYYWRSYAIDPGGANTWSATQTPYSFTTSIRTRILGPARGYSGVRIK